LLCSFVSLSLSLYLSIYSPKFCFLRHFAAYTTVRITHTIEPGQRVTGCLICCHAPDKCPLLGCFPCCDYPEYIVNEMNSSKYVYVRENSLEWNNPTMQLDKGNCCGSSCTELTVLDNVTVLYFDDVYFDNVRDDTRRCNNCKTFCCGGRGEQVQIESTFCCGLCLRGRTPMTCIPSCCPEACCPCIAKVSIFSQGVCFKKCRMYDLHKR